MGQCKDQPPIPDVELIQSGDIVPTPVGIDHYFTFLVV